jgi:dipeptidyl aminopeptidase/acylaminoacyl peptidase
MQCESMMRDTRDTDLYRQAQDLFLTLRKPGTGQISDAAEVHVSADGRQAVFAGTLLDALQGTPTTRICLTDLSTGDTRVLTFGPHVDRLPKFSPVGRQLAFLSDRHRAGDFQLHLLDPDTGATRLAPHVGGWVEYLHWSPDGRRILLGVAGHGADISSGQGAVTSMTVGDTLPSWTPVVESEDESHRWRRVWMYELATDHARQVSPADINIWEAVWCGNDAVAAVASGGPGEGFWYSARLHILDLATGNHREVYTPREQMGWPAASPSGKQLAIVEAVCSDRWIVAGDLRVVETTSGETRTVDTCGVDVSYTEWRSERHLLLAGHRGFETVIGVFDMTSSSFTESWCSVDVTTGGRYITVAGCGEAGDCVLVGESFLRAPEIAMVKRGAYRTVRSFDLGYAERAKAIEAVECIRWIAPDGEQIQGWLLRPRGNPPHPLVMYIHGGPVWHWRPVWLGRAGVPFLMLVDCGYAVFLPNPRGSAGRGQTFARKVLGDMGGADTLDYLSGLDHLVETGIADPHRLGVTGASYGGFMTSWLVTQDSRFAAAVSIAPVTNHVTQHLLSNIPHFVALFLRDTYTNPGGEYFRRSPIMHAHKVKTPTLNICGALDRCTPPEEAAQFHSALRENGVNSVLVTYPEEGHGVRKWPALFDYAARVVGWFLTHMPVKESR